MEALLLAGGYGTRLRPLTYTRPKPLLPIAGRPMLEWVLDRLPDAVDRVVVAVNWQADRLEQYFEETDHPFETVVVRETEALGTGGAIKNCADHITSDRFFALFADIVSDLDMDAMLQQHKDTDAIATISLKEVPDDLLHQFGVAAPAADDPRRIEGFVEKPQAPDLAPSNLVNAGAYLLDRSVLELIPEGRLVSMEKEIFPHILDQNGFYGFPFEGRWIDVGDPKRLLQAAQALEASHWHGSGAIIAADAVVTDSVAGDRVKVGAEASLTRCVLGDDVTIAPGVKLTDCVVGDGEQVTADGDGEKIWTKAVPEGYPAQQVGNALNN